MRKIYKDTTNFCLTIYTKSDISDAKNAYICYKKPDGSIDQDSAIITDGKAGIISSIIGGKINLNMPGWWTFWPLIIYFNDTKKYGCAARLFVYDHGDI